MSTEILTPRTVWLLNPEPAWKSKPISPEVLAEVAWNNSRHNSLRRVRVNR